MVRRRRARRVACSVAAALALAAGGLAVPELRRTNLNANESAAIATLKNVSSAQSQCQASGVVDADRNGSGEYGFFGELAGATPVRGRAGPIQPPLLSAAFREVVAGRVHRGGYVFQMFLPDRAGRGVAEGDRGGDAANDNGVDARQAETLWCCYAWPESLGWSGRRTFFVNQAGDVLATNGAVAAYDGRRRPCPYAAAFAASGPPVMAAPVAANTVGHDGNVWVVV